MNNLVELNKEELLEIEGGFWGALARKVAESAIVGQMLDSLGNILDSIPVSDMVEAGGTHMQASGASGSMK